MRYYLLMFSMILNIIVALSPYYWWYYSIGGILVVKDSLFNLYVNLLGSNYEIINVINYFLFSFRFYVISVSAYYLYTAYKGIRNTYLLIMWASYLYFLDPIIVYLIFEYILGSFMPIKYPFFIIGTEVIDVYENGTKISMPIESYPTLFYWFVLFVGTINLISRFIKR